MTTEQREQAKEQRKLEQMVKENQRIQRDLSKEEFRQKARFKALDVAQYLKPPVTYLEGNNPLSPTRKAIVPDYNVVAAAEKIYQWLIKGIK